MMFINRNYIYINSWRLRNEMKAGRNKQLFQFPVFVFTAQNKWFTLCLPTDYTKSTKTTITRKERKYVQTNVNNS